MSIYRERVLIASHWSKLVGDSWANVPYRPATGAVVALTPERHDGFQMLFGASSHHLADLCMQQAAAPDFGTVVGSYRAASIAAIADWPDYTDEGPTRVWVATVGEDVIGGWVNLTDAPDGPWIEHGDTISPEMAVALTIMQRTLVVAHHPSRN